MIKFFSILFVSTLFFFNSQAEVINKISIEGNNRVSEETIKLYGEIELNKDIMGEKGKLLTENLEVVLSFYNENPITIDLPNQVKCKIDSTDAALKGQTVSSSYKPAVLDNGLNIQVPPFIESGDEIIVDTRNLEYVKKI